MEVSISDLKTLLRIIATREEMKMQNFFPVQSYEESDYVAAGPVEHRLPDGSGTNPRMPQLGKTGQAFMRNVPPARVYQSAPDTPDPRVVSHNLLVNKANKQKLDPRANMLAAAWVQFQIHDWFEHATDPEQKITLDGAIGLDALRLERTKSMGVAAGTNTSIYANTQGHWWDGSQLYGNSKSISDALRVRKDSLLMAELRLPEVADEPMLPVGPPLPGHDVQQESVEQSGFIKNWWVGLSALHTLFAREHNAIVSELRNQPAKLLPPRKQLEDWLFEKARLINSALMAKIHTVEWTPALPDSTAIKLGLYADWWGIGSELTKEFLTTLDSALATKSELTNDSVITEALFSELVDSGIVTAEFVKPLRRIIFEDKAPARKTPSAFERAPDGSEIIYAMSEEFVAVYRMHSLLRDPLPLARIGKAPSDYQLEEISFANSRARMEELGLAGICYSLGITAPAAQRLNNYPAGLSSIRIPGQESRMDIGAIDILRDRERGIPRYVEFKRQISQIRGPSADASPTSEFNTFADICGDPMEGGISAEESDRRRSDADLLQATYAIPADVDLLVGMLAEPLPAGFNFSWTATEIFVLMSVMRLSVDRFFTTDYRPEIYTATGIEWIEQRSMYTILTDHCADIKDKKVLVPDANPFLQASWNEPSAG